MSMFYIDYIFVDVCFMMDKCVFGMCFYFCEFGIESFIECFYNKNNKKYWEINVINMNNSSNKINGKMIKSFKVGDIEKV